MESVEVLNLNLVRIIDIASDSVDFSTLLAVELFLILIILLWVVKNWKLNQTHINMSMQNARAESKAKPKAEWETLTLAQQQQDLRVLDLEKQNEELKKQLQAQSQQYYQEWNNKNEEEQNDSDTNLSQAPSDNCDLEIDNDKLTISQLQSKNKELEEYYSNLQNQLLHSDSQLQIVQAELDIAKWEQQLSSLVLSSTATATSSSSSWTLTQSWSCSHSQTQSLSMQSEFPIHDANAKPEDKDIVDIKSKSQSKNNSYTQVLQLLNDYSISNTNSQELNSNMNTMLQVQPYPWYSGPDPAQDWSYFQFQSSSTSSVPQNNPSLTVEAVQTESTANLNEAQWQFQGWDWDYNQNQQDYSYSFNQNDHQFDEIQKLRTSYESRIADLQQQAQKWTSSCEILLNRLRLNWNSKNSDAPAPSSQYSLPGPPPGLTPPQLVLDLELQLEEVRWDSWVNKVAPPPGLGFGEQLQEVDLQVNGTNENCDPDYATKNKNSKIELEAPATTTSTSKATIVVRQEEQEQLNEMIKYKPKTDLELAMELNERILNGQVTEYDCQASGVDLGCSLDRQLARATGEKLQEQQEIVNACLPVIMGEAGSVILKEIDVMFEENFEQHRIGKLMKEEAEEVEVEELALIAQEFQQDLLMAEQCSQVFVGVEQEKLIGVPQYQLEVGQNYNQQMPELDVQNYAEVYPTTQSQVQEQQEQPELEFMIPREWSLDASTSFYELMKQNTKEDMQYLQEEQDMVGVEVDTETDARMLQLMVQEWCEVEKEKEEKEEAEVNDQVALSTDAVTFTLEDAPQTKSESIQIDEEPQRQQIAGQEQESNYAYGVVGRAINMGELGPEIVAGFVLPSKDSSLAIPLIEKELMEIQKKDSNFSLSTFWSLNQDQNSNWNLSGWEKESNSNDQNSNSNTNGYIHDSDYANSNNYDDDDEFLGEEEAIKQYQEWKQEQQEWKKWYEEQQMKGGDNGEGATSRHFAGVGGASNDEIGTSNGVGDGNDLSTTDQDQDSIEDTDILRYQGSKTLRLRKSLFSFRSSASRRVSGRWGQSQNQQSFRGSNKGVGGGTGNGYGSGTGNGTGNGAQYQNGGGGGSMRLRRLQRLGILRKLYSFVKGSGGTGGSQRVK